MIGHSPIDRASTLRTSPHSLAAGSVLLVLTGCVATPALNYRTRHEAIRQDATPLAKARAICDVESDKVFAQRRRSDVIETSTRDAFIVYRSCMRREGYDSVAYDVNQRQYDGGWRPRDAGFLNAP